MSSAPEAASGEAEAAAAAAAPPPPPPKPEGSGTIAELEGKLPSEQDAKGLQSAATLSRRDRVVLRMEVATKGQARLLTWSVIVLNFAFILASIGLLSAQGTYTTLGDISPLYTSQLVLSSICMAALLVMAVFTVASKLRTQREGRTWSSRQRYFFETAALILTFVIGYTACYVANLSIVRAQPDCGYHWVTMAVFEFLRNIFFSLTMFFLLARLHNMRLWRGAGALDMDPDHRLLMDRPPSDRARKHVIIAILFLIFLVGSALQLANRLKQNSKGANRFLNGCSTVIMDIPCKVPYMQASSAIIAFVVVLLFIVVWAFMARRALNDHRQLPFCRYKQTNIFVRVQIRIIGPIQLAVLLSVLLLDLVPSVQGNCMSTVNQQLGSITVILSLTLAAVVLSILYVPVSRELDSPVSQELLQEFCWTCADKPSAIERRNQHLLALEAPSEREDERTAVGKAVGFIPDKMRWALGKMARVQDGASAAEKLRKEPMFVMETACRLFYWTRLAYRNEPEMDYKWINIKQGLALYGLDQWEKVYDPDTDTHCVIGWSVPRQAAVVAFRGTSSMENAITDIKAWRTTHLPRRKFKGSTVSCHAGFYAAWRSGGFNEKVLKRLREMDDAVDGPMRFWITGHSLGGALAVLAAMDIAKQHPDSEMTVYTFGCPRVGNTAFAKEYDSLIPDTFQLVNATDPVTRIPKVGFKRVGQRVSLDVAGNLILRPTYFEVSVVHRGMSPKDHLTGQYALALATFIKNQMSTTKCMKGGAKGVEQLAGVLDIGTNLCTTNCSLEALRDPALEPELAEKVEEREAQQKGEAAGERHVECGGCCGGLGRGGASRKAAAAEQPTGPEAA